MRRCVLTIVCLLYCCLLHSQSLFTCRYWFDTDHEQTTETAFNDDIWHADIDVSSLSEGIHTLSIQVRDTTSIWSAPLNYLFLKTITNPSENVSYHCWFDTDFDNMQSGVLGDGNLILDVSNLENGRHSIHVFLEGSTLTTTMSYTFIKVEVVNPLIGVKYYCWYDQDYSTVQTGAVGDGIFELDVTGLSNGLHTINVQIDNGSMTAPMSYLFYKIPVGGEGIARWQYWINSDTQNKHTVDLVPTLDTLNIITLLPVETWPIRSSCFHFHPNGEEPYLNAKNEITFRFWSTDNHVLDQSAFYVDEQVQQDIVATVFERNTTETFAAPRDNQITWFKLDAGVGDSLAFVADKACTMQLFAPSGEEVYSATASEAMTFDGCHAWEDGTYYLAVHDMTGSGDEMSVTYEWAYRYAILAYDAHQVGNGGCSTITFQGNGYNSLLDVYFVDVHNDTIHNMCVGHESNTTTTVTCNFYNENLGNYDAVFEFYDETIHINNALEVQEPMDIVLTSTASYPTSFLRGSTVTYTFTITNNGNMSAYAVPLYVYIATPELEDITHIEFEGLKLPSILDYFHVNWDSVQIINNVIDLRKRAKVIGDEHNFFRVRKPNGTDGHRGVRSNFFYVDLAPNESKILHLRLTPDEALVSRSLEAWMTVPDETISPRIPNGSGGSGGNGGSSGSGGNNGSNNPYCCAQELIQCTLGLVCDGLDIAGLLPTGNAFDIASCICETIQHSNEMISQVVCEGEGLGDAWGSLNARSIAGWAASCANAINSFSSLKKALDWADKAMGSLTLMDMTTLPAGGKDIGTDFSECVTKWTHRIPDCFPGDSIGGESTPVNSIDPNDIFGYTSESSSHYMRQEIQNVQYEIEFENDTTLATAAAHTIIVRDTLDTSKFDLNSLAAHSVTIGDKRLDLNGEQTFAKTLDMRPELYVIAQVEQDYDPATGAIQWTISSLDPMTMEPTDNPYQGVLPVNYYGDGVGFIDYSVNLKQMFADGTEISNRAGIIFDNEDMIMTPTWTNIVDAVKPTSHIADVTQVADTLNFIFTSEDNRSGIWYHTLYYRNESTEMEWKVKKSQILENNYKMNLEDLQMTEYFVLATDSAGNKEDKDFLAEYIYSQDNVTLQNNTLVQGWNWWSTYVEQSTMDGLTTVENALGNNGLTIKSQNEFTTNYYENMGYDYWYGGLEAIDNEHGYMINTNDQCNVRMLGTPAQPEEHPIAIGANWNWIGYPVGQQQLLTESLANTFQPESEDIMKSQSGFATYYPGYGWYPDDFVMTPGEGYLYKSNSTTNKTLTYVLSGRYSSTEKQKEIHQWEPEIHKYADNISVIAVLDMNGYEIRENIEVGAFVNGECRGSAILKYFEPTDRYYAMLSIAGEEDDVVSFEIQGSNSETHIKFHKNDVIGSFDAPLPIEFGSLGNDVLDLTLYPNPVEHDANFSIDIPAWEKVSDVTITNVLGLVIRKESTNGINMNGIHEPGIYIVKITCKTGNVYQNVLIVK